MKRPSDMLFKLDVLPAKASVEGEVDGDRLAVRFRAVLLDVNDPDRHIKEFPWTDWLPLAEAPFFLKWNVLVGEEP